VDRRKGTIESTTVVHGEEDLIRVGCIAWKWMSEVSFVISLDTNISFDRLYGFM
jgi:hypothetical protein